MTAPEIVILVVDALERLGIPYMLVGSFSSSFYGVPRATNDADLVVQLGNQSIQSLMGSLGHDFQLDPQISFETITATVRYRLRHVASAFTIELFELSDEAHDQQRFARRKLGRLVGRPAFVPTPEDVIITKLRWSKQGKRQKDVEDVAGVIAVQRDNLDLPYIRQWCDRHGTRELFDRLLEIAPR